MHNDPPHVLVVDDEDRFRDNVVKLLCAHAMAADGASSGEAALEALERSAYDVLLLDVKMPGLSGVGTMKEIRRRGFPVEVIFLTGHASVDDAVEGMRYGASEYLLKPCPTDQLVAKILAVCERKREKERPMGAPGS
ncbi:MAG: response regulator [Desulfovibrionaceae bacterium]